MMPQRCWTRWRCIKRVKAQGLFTDDRHRTAGDCPPGARTHRPALYVRGPGAQILGSYLEGPYFTPQNKGAHPPALFRELDVSELDSLIEVSQHTLRVVALAPEKPGALQAIRHLKQRGIRVMLGHSAATYDQTLAAFEAGADGLVHCYNGMTGLHHREPGMVGAGLTDPRAWLELIADGHHVHPGALRLCACCAKERIVLITDAMQAAGMTDGRYRLCGEEVNMHGGVVRTASGGLAGSTLSLDAAVRNMVAQAGITPADAIHMASLHPARLLGIDHQLGSLKPGKRANMIALDEGLYLQQIWIQGLALPFRPFIVPLLGLAASDRKVFLFLSLIIAFSLPITLFVLFLFFH